MDERIRKAGAAIEKEQQQATDSKFTTAVSVGASVLGALFGRKVVSATNAGRVATAARGVSRMGREAQDVDRAVANEAALVEQRQALADALEQELQGVQADLERRGGGVRHGGREAETRRRAGAARRARLATRVRVARS